LAQKRADRGTDRTSDHRSGKSRQSQRSCLSCLEVGNDDGRNERIQRMLQLQKLRGSDSQSGGSCSSER
jgi:hypothetical protein